MTKVNKLIVCGDSFNSYSHWPKYSGTHWSQILSKKLNIPLLNLASHGCSSKLIAFQMLEALNHPDALVISSPASHYYRLEVSFNKNLSRRSNISLSSFIQRNDCIVDETAYLKSVNANFLGDEEKIKPSQALAILDFIPLGFNKYTDKWSMFYALYKLKEADINFMFYDVDIFGFDRLFEDEEELKTLIGKQRLLDSTRNQYHRYYVDGNENKNFEDPGYHTLPENQQIIAEDFYNEVISRGLLT